MITRYNGLKLLLGLTAFMLFGSINATDSGFNSYVKYFKDLFFSGTYHASTTLKVDGKTETHHVVSGVIITTALITTTVAIMLPIVDQVGGSMAIVIEDYLPNVGPIKDFKDKNKQKREQAKINEIITRYKHEEKVKKFMERTGITDVKDLIKKSNT